ncbi:MAG: ECF transporter S component [Clostridiales bacterium]|nr:ECF transporter S component [Clostridiales bacterium]
MQGKLTFTSKQITGIAVLLALVIVLQAVGGTVSIGPVQLNFTLIPLVLGAIIFGPWVGALLGFASGVVVLIQVIMGMVPFYALIWANDPIVTFLTCVLKTTVAGFLSGLVYNMLKEKKAVLAVFVASAIVPVVNTALFILGCLCMTNSVYAMANGTNVIVFILVSLVTFNFFIELAINLILAPTLHKVLKYIKI